MRYVNLVRRILDAIDVLRGRRQRVPIFICGTNEGEQYPLVLEWCGRSGWITMKDGQVCTIIDGDTFYLQFEPVDTLASVVV